MHDVLTVGIPVLAILAGILFNRQDAMSLRAEILSIHTRLDSIQRDMREFYAEQARHDVRITKLEQAKQTS